MSWCVICNLVNVDREYKVNVLHEIICSNPITDRQSSIKETSQHQLLIFVIMRYNYYFETKCYFEGNELVINRFHENHPRYENSVSPNKVKSSQQSSKVLSFPCRRFHIKHSSIIIRRRSNKCGFKSFFINYFY
jgi:hypothetical protein